MGKKFSFDAEDLACVLALTGKAMPSPAAISAALAEYYPNGEGPSLTHLLADGWLVPTIDGKRLRQPPISFATEEAAQRGLRLSQVGIETVTEAHYSFSKPAPCSVREPANTIGINRGLTEGLFPSSTAITPLIADSAPSPPATTEYQFSYFVGPINNTIPRAAITLAELYRVITAPPPSLRERTRAARAEYEANGKSSLYTTLKLRLDNFSVGGTFTRREDEALVMPSGLLVLDFDGMSGRVAEARADLLADEKLAESLVLLFVSPSGDGLKAVLLADLRYERLENYNRLDRYLTRHYGWGPTLDKRTANISRACFLSNDPDAWLAPAFASFPSLALNTSLASPHETS